MMDDSVVFAVRAKYADDLDELVQCPVCFERPVGPVPMCVQGHHLCQRCRGHVSTCPICKGRFSDARNFVAEELCAKLPDILSSLLEPQHHSSVGMGPMIIKRSVSTQTDKVAQPTDDSVLIVEEPSTSGCRIGFCQAQVPADCMRLHVRDYHRANLIELDMDDYDGFCYSSELKYDFNKLYDYAVHTEELGLFFVSVHIDGEGNLFFDLQRTKSRHFKVLYYHMVLHAPGNLHAPGKKTSIECEGKVPGCPIGDQKFLHARKFEKQSFKCYFEDDSVTLNKRCTTPLKLILFIY